MRSISHRARTEPFLRFLSTNSLSNPNLSIPLLAKSACKLPSWRLIRCRDIATRLNTIAKIKPTPNLTRLMTKEIAFYLLQAASTISIWPLMRSPLSMTTLRTNSTEIRPIACNLTVISPISKIKDGCRINAKPFTNKTLKILFKTLWFADVAA